MNYIVKHIGMVLVGAMMATGCGAEAELEGEEEITELEDGQALNKGDFTAEIAAAERECPAFWGNNGNRVQGKQRVLVRLVPGAMYITSEHPVYAPLPNATLYCVRDRFMSRLGERGAFYLTPGK